MNSIKKLLYVLAIVAIGLSFSIQPAAAKTTLKVLGQPLATGLIQKNKEQPFFL